MIQAHQLKITGNNDGPQAVILVSDPATGAVSQRIPVVFSDDTENPILMISDGTQLDVSIDLDGVLHFIPIEFGLAEYYLVPGDVDEDTHDVVTLSDTAEPFAPVLLLYPPFPITEQVADGEWVFCSEKRPRNIAVADTATDTACEQLYA